MPDLTGWTGPTRVDGFRFRGGDDPSDPHRFAHLSDWELQERTRNLTLVLLDEWRLGLAGPEATALLARAATSDRIRELLTTQELHDLGLGP